MGASSDSSWAHDLARHFKREIAQHADGQHPATEVARVARIKPQVIIAPLSSSVTYDEDDILWGIDKKQLKVGDSVLLARDPSDQPAVVGVLDGNDPDPTKHPAGKLLKSRVNEIGSQSRFWKSPMASSAALNAIKTDANGTIRLRLDNGTLYRFNKATLAWVAASGGGGGGATDLDGLTDVTLSGLSTGQVLRYNGSQWVNYTHDFLTATLAASTYAAIAHTHAQSDVTGLVSDLALKAPLANPTFTGTAFAPTVAIGAGTNIATIGAVNTALAGYSTTGHTHSLTSITVPTANYAMGGYKFTGLAAGSTTGDSLRYEQLFTAGTVGLLGSVSMPNGQLLTIGAGGFNSARVSEDGLELRTMATDTYGMALIDRSTVYFGPGGASMYDWSLQRTGVGEATIGFGGVLRHNTPAAGDNSTKSATTAYVDAAVALVGGGGYLSDLSDTLIMIPHDGDLLTYDYESGEWTNSYNIAYELDQKADLTDLNLLVNRYGDSMTGDLKLQRPTYGEPLQVFDTDGTTKRIAVDTDGTVAWTVSTINTLPLVTKVSGDTHDRFILFPTGAHQWGPGTGAIDTWLWRSSAGVLYVQDYLRQSAAPNHAHGLANKGYVDGAIEDAIEIEAGERIADVATLTAAVALADEVYVSDTPPANPADYDIWVDTSTDDGSLVVANAGNIGDVVFYPFSDTIPDGFIECAGQVVDASAYPSLNAKLIADGYKHGGSGASPLAPNLRTRVPLGYDGVTYAVIGATGGAATHTLTAGEMPSHTHSMSSENNDAGHYTGGWGGRESFIRTTTANYTQSPATGASGSGGAHNNLQPYLVGKWIIRAGNTYTDGSGHNLVQAPSVVGTGQALVRLPSGEWRSESLARQQDLDDLRDEFEWVSSANAVKVIADLHFQARSAPIDMTLQGASPQYGAAAAGRPAIETTLNYVGFIPSAVGLAIGDVIMMRYRCWFSAIGASPLVGLAHFVPPGTGGAYSTGTWWANTVPAGADGAWRIMTFEVTSALLSAVNGIQMVIPLAYANANATIEFAGCLNVFRRGPIQ